jgi:hypothetical protein
MRSAVRILAWPPLAVAVAGGSVNCHDPQTSVTIGVTAEPLPIDVDRYVVTTTIDGVDNAQSVPTTALPFQTTAVAPPNDRGDSLTVSVQAFARGAAPGAPAALTRLVETNFAPRSELLLRIRLEASCAGPSAPACPPPTATCAAGACRDPYVAPATLEPYDPGWAVESPDACKPAGAGAPSLEIGVGASDFAPLVDGQTVQIIAGPQGGHHIWMAARLHNFHQANTVITMRAAAPMGNAIAASSLHQPLTPDGAPGACRVVGMRLIVDNPPTTNYEQFFGKPLDITLDATVGFGDHASVTAQGVVAPGL